LDFGAHLPQIDFAGDGFSLGSLNSFVDAARDLNYSLLSANDHMLFSRPWLDGPTALAAVLPRTGSLALMTTVALPVIRGPVQAAKTLAAIDLLSGSRLAVGVGPGSSRADYEAVGLDFEERWKRLDEAVAALRALWRGSEYRGAYYSTEGMNREPRPAGGKGPPIWIGSWGSDAGIRRTARLGDGWLASAYNTTPEDFRSGWQKLTALLAKAGKDDATFPNALATMWTFVTENREEARRVLEDVLARMLNREPSELAQRLTIGSAEECALKLRAYRDAGVQRVLIWPVLNPIHQLEVFKKNVEPLVKL
jgi:alkanesulfonate monooxygenase SsuD/methylene tetrahydromethanopterin reductase-like flavin-dependent oxidoreductase (luciferase family)